MGTRIGPKIPTNNLLFTLQPGNVTLFNENCAVNLARDVVEPSRGRVIGPRRQTDFGTNTTYDDKGNYNFGPSIGIENIPGAVYSMDTSTSNIYTISLWVRLISFPTHYRYNMAEDYHYSVRKKRTSLARFNYSWDGIIEYRNDGYIEFGAMSPYYRDASYTKNYKYDYL